VTVTGTVPPAYLLDTGIYSPLGKNDQGVKLTTVLCSMLRLKMGGFLLLFAFMKLYVFCMVLGLCLITTK
jgi:hypothetical protein